MTGKITLWRRGGLSYRFFSAGRSGPWKGTRSRRSPSWTGPRHRRGPCGRGLRHLGLQVEVLAPGHIEVLDRQVSPVAPAPAGMAFQELDVGEPSPLNVVKDFHDVRQAGQGEVMFTGKVGELTLGVSPMEQLPRVHKALLGIALELPGVLAQSIEDIVVNLGDGDGSVQVALGLLGGLQNGDALGLAGSYVDRGDFFRPQPPLQAVSSLHFPSGDLPRDLNGDDVLDHGRIGHLDEPDDNRAGIGY